MRSSLAADSVEHVSLWLICKCQVEFASREACELLVLFIVEPKLEVTSFVTPLLSPRVLSRVSGKNHSPWMSSFPGTPIRCSMGTLLTAGHQW